ncbi:hypothetical protein C7S15_5373 [Burkholderia cepacia]|nr:hypothetical protein [Burkholderia cepacia]
MSSPSCRPYHRLSRWRDISTQNTAHRGGSRQNSAPTANRYRHPPANDLIISRTR